LALSSGVKIQGDACSAFVSQGASSSISGDKKLAGECANLNNLGIDIANASKTAKELANQFQFGNIESTQTLNATTQNAYAVNKLYLQTGEFLTIKGKVNDNIVINVAGLASIGSGAGILLQGGILADNVVFNFLDNASVTNFIFGGADISGTFLSNSRSFQLGDGATLNNSRFLTNASIQANVQTVKFGGTTQVPEPSTIILLLLALSFIVFRTNARDQ
jgi:autotransporter adhesin